MHWDGWLSMFIRQSATLKQVDSFDVLSVLVPGISFSFNLTNSDWTECAYPLVFDSVLFYNLPLIEPAYHNSVLACRLLARK